MKFILKTVCRMQWVERAILLKILVYPVCNHDHTYCHHIYYLALLGGNLNAVGVVVHELIS